MLNHSQINTLLILRNREGNVFSQLPVEIIHHIIKVDQDSDSNIAKLLHEVVYGNPAAVKVMLDANPRLLLGAGNVITPSGDRVQRVTPFECALGAGDDKMANLIASYFAKLEKGEKEQARQYARYKPHIDNILNQAPYNFNPLFDIIKKSSVRDITAALNKDFEYQSPLCAALIQFRHDFKPRTIKTGMHFNCINLIEVLRMFYNDRHQLRDKNNYDKCNLVWRQLVGYVMRGLPACDRQGFAQGLSEFVKHTTSWEKSLEYKQSADSIPITTSNNSLTGLGFDFAVDIFTPTRVLLASMEATRLRHSPPSILGDPQRHLSLLRKLYLAKTLNLRKICSHACERKRLGA